MVSRQPAPLIHSHYLLIWSIRTIFQSEQVQLGRFVYSSLSYCILHTFHHVHFKCNKLSHSLNKAYKGQSFDAHLFNFQWHKTLNSVTLLLCFGTKKKRKSKTETETKMKRMSKTKTKRHRTTNDFKMIYVKDVQ